MSACQTDLAIIRLPVTPKITLVVMGEDPVEALKWWQWLNANKLELQLLVQGYSDDEEKSTEANG